MKMTKLLLLRLLVLLLLALMVCGALTACAGNTLRIAKGGESDYVIVYPAGDAGTKQVATYLQSELESLLGATLQIVADSEAAAEDGKEILVGETNRAASRAAYRELREEEYVVRAEDNTLVLLGSNTVLTKQACTYMLENLLSEKGKIKGEGELYRNEKSYDLTALTLNGRPFTDYTVLVPNDSDSCWNYVLEQIGAALKQASGYRILTRTYNDATKAEAMQAYAPAIVLEKAGGGLAKNGYKISQEGDNLTVQAGTDATALLLMDRLLTNHLFAGVSGEAAITLTVGTHTASIADTAHPLTAGSTMRAMTFNVRSSTDRNGYMMATVATYAPDFVCMQEYYEPAHTTATAYFAAMGYGAVGLRFDTLSPKTTAENTYTKIGSKCNTPIFYRKDRWEPIEEDAGAFLFYWEDRYPGSNTKSATFGVFRSKTNPSETVIVISAHYALMMDSYKSWPGFAHYTNAVEGAAWRAQNTAEILTVFDRLRAKYPSALAVIAGDMNCTTAARAYTNYTDQAALADSLTMAPANARDTGGTFHSFGKAPTNPKRIDHMMVTDDVARVLRHFTLTTDLALQASDHCALMIDIARK